MLDESEKIETRVSSFRVHHENMYSPTDKGNAIYFRKKGYSLREIAHITHISRATLSVWLQGVTITDKEAKERLLSRTKNYGTNYGTPPANK